MSERNYYDEYLEHLKKRTAELIGQQQQIAQYCVHLYEHTYITNSDDEVDQLKQILGVKTDTQSVSFEPLIEVVERLSDKATADLFRYMTEHATEYPYSVGYTRRPYRTSDISLHIAPILSQLISLFFLNAYEFDLHTYLTERDYPLSKDYRVQKEAIAIHIAYAWDHDQPKVKKALHEIIYGDNQTALFDRSMIEGMLMSHQPEAYNMISELLIAARLQEGLRQSIVEQLDEGTLEATMTLLRTIIENDLIRYSSIVRALGTWTGINLEATNTRVSKQLITQAYEALSDQSVREEWLSSANANHIYMSLWATAVHEEQDVYERIQHLMDTGARYQKIVALYVLRNSQNKDLRLRIAQPHLAEEDDEIRYWVLVNYDYECYYSWETIRDMAALQLVVPRTPLLEDKQVRRQDFEHFRNLFSSLNGREISFQSSVLDFVQVSYSADLPIKKMLYLAAYDMDEQWISEILQLKDKLSPDLRGTILQHYLSNTDMPEQRQFVFASLSDKSMSNRELALKQANKLILNDTELQDIENLLKLKTGSLRQGAIQLLLNQPVDSLDTTVHRLIQSKSELQRLAGLETISELQSKPERSEQYERLLPLLDTIAKPTAKEQVLIDKLGSTDKYNENNGFGLFDPRMMDEWLKEKPAHPDFLLQRDVFTIEPKRITDFLQGLNDLIHEHRDHEYTVEYYSGYKETLLIGNRLRGNWQNPNADSKTLQIEQYPLPEVWQHYLQQSDLPVEGMIQLYLYTQSEMYDQTLDDLYSYFIDQMDYMELGKHRLLEGWRKTFIESIYPLEQILEIQTFYQTLPYRQQLDELIHRQQLDELIRAYLEDSDKQATFAMVRDALITMIYTFPQEKLKEESGLFKFLISPWRSLVRSRLYDQESSMQMFHIFYTLEFYYGQDGLLGTTDYARAYEWDKISDNEIYSKIMSSDLSRQFIRELTSQNIKYDTQINVKEYPKMIPIRDAVLARILEIELSRGELVTGVTSLAMNIQRVEGTEVFVRILSNLQKETFVRGYIYGYGNSITKKETFSYLLKNTYPLEGEDEHKLESLLQQYPIDDKKLLEAAMYAPQWIEIIAKHLGWKGLRSAAWYFHAHINETFSAEKETIVAHYSPISPQEFNDGAFDIVWFRQAYDELGTERFDILYECAKYISAGSNHRRSQLFADAVLGKLDLASIQQSVADKRNKDQLLAYSLIPLASGTKRDADIRQRYEFIQLFLKQSKTFGAQRRASEGAVSAIALDNLARNAGYTDVTRLQWDMESRKLDDLLAYFEPHAIEEGLNVSLVIDHEGQTSLTAIKQEKPLKSVPARLNKNEYIIRLKEVKSELTDQYRRARQELERSMTNSTTFTADELIKLSHNPVLAPLVNTLVLQADQALGYLDGEASLLRSPDGTEHPLQLEDQVIIAHPVHLYESGQWSLYQRDLFERQQRQPFKQVFRELYLPNEDERASGNLSRRYAGYQIQPNKAVALLRGRGWTVSYEEGLQKVYYKENIIANLYALADWFSPADTEAPTLETVQFYNRSNYERLPFDQVSPLIFSEIMRDVDLVVSVAHVGGVDPESSLTTIEMRRVIVEESLRLLHIDNVKVEGNHARIEGSLGNYSVHLGSAIVYQQAASALHIIPVHSQHRGRLFLPFMDEDPRTAEILSKIVMLAQDHKIKDPQILAQLKPQ
ncbi:hypothetical protein PTI45_00260 [Paenibacillus nuruki]|uniref:DUF4132 domain-containing protein n=1 Tax=Paenibacillus nuruki TaxID=1886670 RepID=A0A1E3L934_9BACL|nr:DUF4132 domain-containing protein [Paenibacillus nuruki]ODP30327.1 hypothetical protein PTI45_00260 [Paenibacillus nuruki]